MTRAAFVPPLLLLVAATLFVVRLGQDRQPISAHRGHPATATVAVSSPADPDPRAAPTFPGIHGVLRRSQVNPRYFTDASERAVYLTGSHIHDAFQDPAAGEAVDYQRWLSLLRARHHNFTRLWHVENWTDGPRTPSPYVRSGPGTATDGGPRYDLDRFDPAYFHRLRQRVIDAGRRDIYVGFCFFNGWAVRDNGEGNPWSHHVFHKDNNVNGIDGDSNHDGQGGEVFSLQADPRVLRHQEAFVRKVVDTLNDLDNVVWEIANEARVESVPWQYGMVRSLRAYEASKPKRHPIGMSSPAFGTPNDAVFRSPADWVAPAATRFDDLRDPWVSDMPVADGTKVILLDTDHTGWAIFRGEGAFQRTYGWRAFTRGMNPILMEDAQPPFETVRVSLGHTLKFVQRMNLTRMAPRGVLASSGFALADPRQEYLVLQPESGEFTLDLTAASRTFHAEWFDPTTGRSSETTPLRGGARVTLTPPFAGPAIAYLRALQ